MKTRTLLLLSVACGLAVLVAGAALMLRLATQDDPVPAHRAGEAVRIGDATVVAEAVDVTGDLVTVRLTVGGVDDPDGAADFRVLALDRLVPPNADSPCTAFTVVAAACELRFDVTSGLGNPLALAWRRAGDQAVWQLPYGG